MNEISCVDAYTWTAAPTKGSTMLYQPWLPTAREPLDLEPVGIPLDIATALSGLSRPIIYCAAARGDVTLYRGDHGVTIMDYRDLRPLLHSLPPWTPPKRRTRKLPQNDRT